MNKVYVCKCGSKNLNLIDTTFGDCFVSLKFKCYDCDRSIHSSYVLRSVSHFENTEYKGTEYYDIVNGNVRGIEWQK